MRPVHASLTQILGGLAVSLIISLFPCATSRAGLFPHLSSRYPVGDPDVGNPLDRDREGPKTLAAGDLNGDGISDIVTGNLDGSISILLANDMEGMREQALFRAGGSIRSVVVTDVNGDGKQDVVAADITEGVVVLLGNGDGTLELFVKIPLGPARSLAAADCNGDGIQDLLVAASPPDCERGYPGDRWSCVLPGKGDGSFGDPFFLTGDDTGCLYDVGLADMNQDGNVDALVLDYTNREILVFAGNGDGTFTTFVPELVLEGRGTRSFTVAYLDERLQDGKPPPGATLDLVAANRDTSNLDVFLGLGGFKFAEPLSYPCGDSPRGVAAGDLNGDGWLELVVTNRNANTISVLRGLGDARFSSPLEIAAGTSPREIVLADLTGDGALDAAAGNRISGDISIFTGSPGLAGFLVPEHYYPAGITPVGVVSEDFNGDGFPDAATVNLRSHDVRVRLNLGDGRFGEEVVYPVNYQPTSIATDDLDGDGRMDLVVSCMGMGQSRQEGYRGTLVALLGRGNGTFSEPIKTFHDSVSFQPYWLRLGDLSGDGVLDAAVGGRTGELVVFEGGGNGTFVSARELPQERRGGTPLTLTLGDFDSDRRLDIATSRGEVLLNDSDFFGSDWNGVSKQFPVSRGDWVVESADLDRDGALDLIVALTFVKPDPIAVHFGRGDGTFLPATIYETGMGVVALAAEDMDGDGILDIVSGNRCTADVTILRGLGDRTFERLETIRTYSVEGVQVRDLNGDGKLDLVGAGLALWVVLQGDDTHLVNPQATNIAGILPAEGIYINELMALNRNFFKEQGGTTPDWLELYNHSGDPKDLTGWILRQYDREGNERDWQFPDGTVVPPMGHRVVLCTSREDPRGEPRSMFALSSDGEGVALLDPDKKVVDRVDFPAMPPDISYGRFVDGARYLCYNPLPTMGPPWWREIPTSPSRGGPSGARPGPSMTWGSSTRPFTTGWRERAPSRRFPFTTMAPTTMGSRGMASSALSFPISRRSPPCWAICGWWIWMGRWPGPWMIPAWRRIYSGSPCPRWTGPSASAR